MAYPEPHQEPYTKYPNRYTDVIKPQEGVYMRFFTRGIALISDKDISLDLELPDGKIQIYDLFAQRYIKSMGGKFQVTLKSQIYASGLKHPIGRIYRYEH